MRRSGATLMALALFALAGCSAGLPGTSSTPPPESTATDPPVPAHPDDPTDVLFQVDPARSLLVPLLAAFAAPTITVYRDGTVIRQAPHSGPGSRPPHFLTGRAGPESLAAFIDELESWDRPRDDGAFGVPNVTDLASTRVVVHTPATTARVDIYGFQTSLDRYVDDAARANRAALRRLVDQASALLPGGQPYVPAAVRAVDVGWADPKSDAPDWPGPPPEDFAPGRFLGFGCLVIDESAAEIFRAAAANESAVWTTPSGPRTIAVTPLLPGHAACI